MGVILYQILAGGGTHPYLREDQLNELFQVPEDISFRAAALIFDAPALSWPKEMIEAYPPDLLQLVGSLLVRDQGRAGLNEVRKSEVMYQSNTLAKWLSKWPLNI